MNIKLIAFDLDNTTLNRESNLSQGNKEAIERAIAAGIEPVIATGRAITGIPASFFDIEGIHYAITSNGARIVDMHTKETLRQYTLSTDSVHTLIDICHECSITYEIFCDGKAYVSNEYYADPASYGMPSHILDYIKNTRTPVDDIDSFIENNIDSIENVAFVVNGWEVHNKVAALAKNRTNDTFITGADVQWVEVMSEECGKGKGLKHVCDLLDIDLKDTAAFGDADNDIEMLEYSGYAVAVANASEECKKIADFVTLSNYEDGVAYAIDKILGKKESNE